MLEGVALSSAKEIAIKSSSNAIDTPHVILALINDNRCSGYDILKELVDIELFKKAVSEKITRTDSPPIDPQKTPILRRVLEESCTYAEFLNMEELDTQHILYGLVKVSNHVAY